MKPMQFTIEALATLLVCSVLWSCNDGSPSEVAETRSAQAQPSPPAMPSAGSGMMDQRRAACPMVVQGAKVSAADTDGGVALTFTTDTGDVADLRTRVQQMAQMYKRHHGQAGMMWHHMGGQGGEGRGRGGPGMGGNCMGGNCMRGKGMGGKGMGHMAGSRPMPAASHTVTDTDKGARLELRPTDPTQLAPLREHVRRHQQRMNSGKCWVLKGQATKTP